MSFFRRPDYQSDATQFIQKLKSERPELDAQQVAGRALLWDKQVDRDIWEEYGEARVAQKPLRVPDPGLTAPAHGTAGTPVLRGRPAPSG